MSAVVLKCQNCGTTQAAAGECDACHEAEVRYFCTSHPGGRWLESASCPQCGARFGESRPAARPASPLPAPPPAPASRMPPPRSPPRPPPMEAAPWRRTEAPEAWPPAEEVAPMRYPPRRSWPDLIRNRRVPGSPEMGRPYPAPPPPGAVAGAFLRRILMLALLLFAVLTLSSLFSGGQIINLLLNILLSS